jgi:hypothetical protein
MKRIAVAGLGCTLVLTGCGGRDTAGPDRLAGSEVATMAERELEAENPRMAPGSLTCPDLAFDVGASVRCLRTTELSEGRVVKVRGTVEVTSLAAGGRLHVALDERAAEFGLAGNHLAAEVRRRYAQRFRVQPDRVDCPYLRGAVGTRVSCRLEADDAGRDVDVEVTAVDQESYRTDFRVAFGGAADDADVG